jgi:hypothetical protein
MNTNHKGQYERQHMKKNLLFICGSLNQTTMMHKISMHLPDYHKYFTPFYADGFLDFLSRKGLTDFTILGGKHRKNTLKYIRNQQLSMDYKGINRDYDLIISGTDTIVQKNIRKTRFVLVQEGMIEPETWIFPLVKHFRLPRFLANTAATGLSDAYEVFCVASPGYRDEFIRKGVNPQKIVVTGIPNFDNFKSYYNNDFPDKGYVLVATSPLRETWRYENRRSFIHKVEKISKGRPIIFKLHPIENVHRARREILSIIPRASVLSDGNTEFMVANCEVLITQISSVTFVGLALGKEVHTDLNISELNTLMPIQNGGKSAKTIANICRKVVQTPLNDIKSLRNLSTPRQELLGNGI